ncbi:MAG: tRNA lysidine(34) synthetase TilS [Terriglobales bacterium]
MAVSGGSDSVALLLILQELSQPLGLQLALVHLDHGWRPDSAADAEFVAALARRLELPLHARRAAPPPPGGNREQLGRRLRYAFFHRLIAAGELDCVATAHTADDQAETVLLRLLRGASPAGLAGILPSRDQGRIVRPLLALRRLELRQWLQRRGQPWRDDPTNLDLTRRRNRIRLETLPQLSRQFNPRLVERLAALAEVARAEEAFWASYLPPLFERTFAPSPAGLSAPRSALAALPPALQRRLLREAVRRLQGDLRQLDFAALETLLAWLALPPAPPRQWQLGRVACRLSARSLQLAAPARP